MKKRNLTMITAGLALMALTVSACGGADLSNTFTEAQQEIFCQPDAASDLGTLQNDAGDQAAMITLAEVNSFAQLAQFYPADEAILAIVIAGKLRAQGVFASDEAYATLIRFLRYQVEGLAMSLRQAPGMWFFRCPESGRMFMYFDPQGISYQQIDFVFTTDNWASARAVTFEEGFFGSWLAHAENLPANGRMAYALHIWGTDGRDFWLNNGREQGIYGGRFWLNYSFELPAASGFRLPPSAPAFVQLLRTFQHPASPAGTTISSAEFNLLVEEITWEGGYAVHDPEVIRPLLREFDDLAAAGANFEPGIFDPMRNFVQTQLDMFPWATYPSATFDRTCAGSLLMTLNEAQSQGARLYYATDGWNTPHAVECPLTNGLPLCDLGHIPPGTLLSYAILIFTQDGGTRWIHAYPNNNFFHTVNN